MTYSITIFYRHYCIESQLAEIEDNNVQNIRSYGHEEYIKFFEQFLSDIIKAKY